MIAKDKHVSFHYILTADGQVIENSRGSEPLTYIHGGGQILPALEAQMEGMVPGDTREVELAAGDAYGEVNPEALQEVPIEQIPEGARQVGAPLQAEGHNGMILVKEVRDDVVVLDFNHPLAGKDLVFDIEIVGVEDAPQA